MLSYQGYEVHEVMVEKKKGTQNLKQQLLTVTQVADLLNIHPNTVRHWSNTGIIKAYRIGVRRDRRFRPEDIDKLIGTSQL